MSVNIFGKIRLSNVKTVFQRFSMDPGRPRTDFDLSNA